MHLFELFESSYEGNIGVMELFDFMGKASSDQIEQFKAFVKGKNAADAWELVQSVTGSNLVGDEFHADNVNESYEDGMIKNIIPVGKYDEDHAWWMTAKAEKVAPHVKILNTKKLVDAGKLKGTQNWLDLIHGGGDAVLPDYEDKPCIVYIDGIYYIIDGHHRMSKSYNSGEPVEVYLFKI